MDIERYNDVLRHFGREANPLRPRLWFMEEDTLRAGSMWAECGFDQQRTIALFACGNVPQNRYAHWSEALAALCVRNNFSVAALGEKKDHMESEETLAQLREHGVPTHNFLGKSTFREAAAFLRDCRLALGVDTGLAHAACAVDVPLIVLVGGGTFGRFFPYSSRTTAVCLPLECYGCGWNCPYPSAYCVAGIKPETVAQAVDLALAQFPGKERGTLFMQRPMSWPRQKGLPVWRSPHSFILSHKSKTEDGLEVALSV
jgi:ADP-heptose:LPS heptosyltransferase